VLPIIRRKPQRSVGSAAPRRRRHNSATYLITAAAGFGSPAGPDGRRGSAGDAASVPPSGVSGGTEKLIRPN